MNENDREMTIKVSEFREMCADLDRVSAENEHLRDSCRAAEKQVNDMAARLAKHELPLVRIPGPPTQPGVYWVWFQEGYEERTALASFAHSYGMFWGQLFGEEAGLEPVQVRA